MIDQNLKAQVQSIFADLKHHYKLIVSASKSHPSRQEFVSFLEDVESTSPNISIEVISGSDLSFSIFKDDVDSGISFRAIPTGHEFTTLLLAILNLDGKGKNLPDATTAKRIQALNGPLEIKSYISLTCTNCPDVVQSLNIISILNPNVTHQIIDGGINKEEVDALNIQAVPSVYANDKPLHIGRSSLGELLGKLEDFAGSNFNPASSEPLNYDVVVVGGGPAGSSAAIYSARKGFKVALVADHIGGQVKETVDIENLISTPKTTGAQLAADLKAHINDYSIDVLENRLVENIELQDGMKHLKTSLGETLITPAVIVATGASWRKLNVPGEDDYIGSGVAFCTHCDGPFYKNKDVVVVGGGNSGLEAAIDLSSIAKKVTVLEFADTLKGDQVLQDKLNGMSNVTIFTSAQTLKVDGDGKKLSSLTYKSRLDEQEHHITTDGVFVQIGLKANSGVFTDFVKTNRMGEIEVDASCRTNVAGIYGAGDVTVVPYKQIVVAMGEGAKAALSAFDDQIKGLQVQ